MIVSAQAIRPMRGGVRAPLILTLAILAVGLAGVYAYGAGGASLFVAMIETGIAWCF